MLYLTKLIIVSSSNIIYQVDPQDEF